MGEARRKLEVLGTTRKLPLARGDMVTLLSLLLAPDEAGKPLTFGSRKERRSAMSALDQFGILETWQDAQEELSEKKGSVTIAELGKKFAEKETREVSVDAIQWMLNTLDRPMNIRDSLAVAYFEDMLEKAMAGTLRVVDTEPAAAVDESPIPESPTA